VYSGKDTTALLFAMYEIRIAWSYGFGSRPGNGPWRDDTPENREILRLAIECGCELFGQGTHWLESRRA